MATRHRLPPPESCPVCGEDVPRHALACPECGADHESGWREDASGIDAAGDDDFEYDEFVKREFGEEHSPKPHGISWLWWVTAVLVLLGGIYLWLSGLFAR